LLGLKRLRQAAEDVVLSRLKDSKVTPQSAKIEFLESVEEYFPRYFDELYDAVWLKKNGYVSNKSGSDEQVFLTNYVENILKQGIEQSKPYENI
jgi:hypothetical protein